MEFHFPPSFKNMETVDGKQEINLEWPYKTRLSLCGHYCLFTSRGCHLFFLGQTLKSTKLGGGQSRANLEVMVLHQFVAL